MDDLLLLVRDTLRLIRPEKEILLTASLPAAPLIQKNEESPVPLLPPAPSKKLAEPALLLNAFGKILQALSPRTKIIDTPLCDKLAIDKKMRWKKQIASQEALLVFKAPCHPLFYDLEQAVNTKLMSAILISLEEFAALKDSKARLVIFERSLSTEIDNLKSSFFQCRFVEIPPPSSLTNNPSLKRTVWQTIQNP